MTLTADDRLKARKFPPAPTGTIRELARDPLHFFLGITAQYGDIVSYRSGPERAYLINHPDYVRQVLLDNQRNYSKATFSNQIFKRVIGEGLNTSEGDVWRKQRRMMQPSFHATRIEPMDRIVVLAVQSMLDEWQHAYEQGQAIDVSREMAALTLNITTRALFGVDMSDEARAIGEIVNRAAHYFEKPSDPRLIQSVAEFGAVVDRIIQHRRQGFKDGGDLLSSMLLACDDENGASMTDTQLRDQIMSLMLAGYETTANALSWTWYLLSQNRWAIDRARHEVRATLNGRHPAYADLESLPYVCKVFDESLRIFPPAWILGRCAIGEDEIGGYYVAPGTVIAICIYTLHRHPAFWDRPEVFDPERFSSENSAGRAKFSYIPFSAGPRQCIGNAFGLMEAQLALACILQRFELHLLPEIEVKPHAIYVLRPNRDLMMSLHP